jgi:hypothetical protein
MKQTVTVSQKYFPNQLYNCVVDHNKSISIHCTYMNVYGTPKPTYVKFKIGDSAEYGSYNLHYIGTIVSITDKVVTIDSGHKTYNIKGERVPELRRLKLGEFAARNWNFDLQKLMAYNLEESQCI